MHLFKIRKPVYRKSPGIHTAMDTKKLVVRKQIKLGVTWDDSNLDVTSLMDIIGMYFAERLVIAFNSKQMLRTINASELHKIIS